MAENQGNQSLPTRPTNCWNESELANIVKTLTVLINGQKAFGKQHSVADTLAYYRLKLEARFTANQVIHALEVYTDTHNDIPAPADIFTILQPSAPRISQAEFIHAKEQWKLEGYPSHSYYAVQVKQFERENAGDRAPLHKHPIHPQLAAKVKLELKKIEGYADDK